MDKFTKNHQKKTVIDKELKLKKEVDWKMMSTFLEQKEQVGICDKKRHRIRMNMEKGGGCE